MHYLLHENLWLSKTISQQDSHDPDKKGAYFACGIYSYICIKGGIFQVTVYITHEIRDVVHRKHITLNFNTIEITIMIRFSQLISLSAERVVSKHVNDWSTYVLTLVTLFVSCYLHIPTMSSISPLP